jgi:hypothetical protein
MKKSKKRLAIAAQTIRSLETRPLSVDQMHVIVGASGQLCSRNEVPICPTYPA